MASEFVNKHITRVLANSGTDMDLTWLASVDSLISSQNLLPYLIDCSDPSFGVVKNGSNQISRSFGLGATYLPRIGDLAPSTLANCVYNATGINSKPSWTISNGKYMYYGTARGGTIRLENIRRKHRQGLTVIAVYKEGHGFGQGIWAYGQDKAYLTTTTSGSTFSIASGFSNTYSTSLPSNASHIVGGTFDQDNVISYVEGVASGAGTSGYIAAKTDGSYGQYRPLLGGANGRGAQQFYQLGIGSFGTSSGIYNDAPSSTVTRTISGGFGTASVDISFILILAKALNSTEMAAWNTLLRTRY